MINTIYSIRYKKSSVLKKDGNKAVFFSVNGDLTREEFVSIMKSHNEDLDLRTVRLVQEMNTNRGITVLHELTDILENGY